MSEVRQLLERAAADAGEPTTATATVYARARTVRLRRRIATATTALVVAGTALGVGALPQWHGEQTPPIGVAAPPSAPRDAAQGVREIEKVLGPGTRIRTILGTGGKDRGSYTFKIQQPGGLRWNLHLSKAPYRPLPGCPQDKPGAVCAPPGVEYPTLPLVMGATDEDRPTFRAGQAVVGKHLKSIEVSYEESESRPPQRLTDAQVREIFELRVPWDSSPVARR